MLRKAFLEHFVGCGVMVWTESITTKSFEKLTSLTWDMRGECKLDWFNWRSLLPISGALKSTERNFHFKLLSDPLCETDLITHDACFWWLARKTPICDHSNFQVKYLLKCNKYIIHRKMTTRWTLWSISAKMNNTAEKKEHLSSPVVYINVRQSSWLCSLSVCSALVMPWHITGFALSTVAFSLFLQCRVELH